MFKTLVTGASLLTLTACATVSPTREVARTASLAPAAARACVSDTATRIPVKPDQCAGFGRSYDQDDIQRTGRDQLGPALRMLDPAVTLHGR